MSNALHFVQITAEHQDYKFFNVFLTTKSLSQNISITLLQISLKLHEHRGCYWRKKLPSMIFEEQFSVPRYTSASKIGNSVILLLWQLRCRCNPDHNKFSSLSNTTLVAIFSKLSLWRRSLCSNLGGIGPGKLYRVTLREAACEDRGSAVSDPFGKSLIFCPKIPLGRLFSKSNSKVSEILFASEIRKKLKLRSRCSFSLDQMSKIRCEIKVSLQS